MRIAFKFHYIHDNGLFTRLINRIQQLSDTPLYLHEASHHYTIEAQGEQAELESLAEQISTLVPRSLFLRESKVEAVDEDESDESIAVPLPLNNVTFEVPYCPECQESVIKTFDPFISCSVCGFSDSSLCMEDLTAHTAIMATDNEDFFLKLADILIEKKEITLPTYNGIRKLKNN